ncbi:MAG TPA: hypothetical protein VNI78_03435, partial [Vicinamibacterales bacterium]|nr:hypothetical protein [Vicinamibacterales bacterium]
MSLILDALRRARSDQPAAADADGRAGSPLGLGGRPDGQIPAGLGIGRPESRPSQRSPARWRRFPLILIIGLGVWAVFQLSIDIQPQPPAGQPEVSTPGRTSPTGASQATGAAPAAVDEAAALRQAAAEALEELARTSAGDLTARQESPSAPSAAGGGAAEDERGVAGGAPPASAPAARLESPRSPVRERPEPAAPVVESRPQPPSRGARDAATSPARPRSQAAAPRSAPAAPRAAEPASKPPIPSQPAPAPTAPAAAA